MRCCAHLCARLPRVVSRELPRERGGKPEVGFTLLELLVSVTVVALLATAMLFGFRIAASAWGRSNDVLEEQRRVSATLDLLGKQMAEMTPYAPWVREGSQDVFFQGEPQAVRFLSRYSLVSRAGSGLYLIEYQVADAADGTKQLLLNEVRVRNATDLGRLRIGAEQTEAGPVQRFAPFERHESTRVLLQGVGEMRLEYYRPATGAEPGAWGEQWVARRDELPRGMAVRLRVPSEETRRAPLSVVAQIPSFTRRQQP